MKHIFIISICFLLIGITKGFSRNLFESGQNNRYKCSIVTAKNNSQIIFIGIFKNNTNKLVKITYKLEAVKKGISGNSNDNQSGEVSANANGEVVLSKVSFNLLKNDTYSVLLKVLKDNKVISTDSLKYDND